MGRLLAETLGWSFADTDGEIVKDCGMTISEMVSGHGWGFFREKERIIVKRLSQRDAYVIATGGGAVIDYENVKHMKQNGVIIWLKASPETIKTRILQDKNTESLRPSLTAKGFYREIEEIVKSRNPLYESAMDFEIETDDFTVDDICVKIIEQLMAMGMKKKILYYF